MVRQRRGDDSGFTLLELMVTTALMGIMLALAVAPYRNYRAAQDHLNSTRRVVATLRNAQVRSVAEAVPYRVQFSADGSRYVVERKQFGTWSHFRTHRHLSDKVHVADASFTDSSGIADRTVYFYPRGAATKGQLAVVRDGKDKRYTVSVEGLTARVSYS